MIFSLTGWDHANTENRAKVLAKLSHPGIVQLYDFGDREEVRLTVQSKLTEQLSTTLFLRRDLDRNENLRASIGIAYQNECFTFELVGERNFFSDREIQSEDSIFFRIELRNLGGFDTF